MPAAAESGPRAYGRSASSRLALEEERTLYSSLGLDDGRSGLRDARSPSTSTISSASTSWYEAHGLPPKSPPPPQSKPPRPSSQRPLGKAPSLQRPLAKLPSLQHPLAKSPSLQHPLTKSPSRPAQFPRQRALVKSPSLPIPSSPIESGPLPVRPGSKSVLPKVQVFVSRPMTPRSMSGPRPMTPRSMSGPRPSPARPPLPPSRFADAEPEPPRSSIRRVSSARAATPSPAFWKVPSTGFDAMQGESLLGPRTEVSDARAPGSSGDLSAIIDSDFGSSSGLSVASEPASASIAAEFVEDPPTGILASLRNLNFRRARGPDPWNVPAARAPTPRFVDVITGSSNPYAPPQRRDPGARRMTPRVFSFDPIRSKKHAPVAHRRYRQPGNGGYRERREMDVKGRDDVGKSLSLYRDDYIGFSAVSPRRRELIRVRSRRWMGRFLGRRGDHN